MSERELFEATIKKLGKTDSYTFDKHEDGSYKFDMIHFGWKIWQASANRQGYKLVPVEPSKACLNNLGDVIFDNFGTTTTEVDRCAEKAYKAMIGAVG